MILNFEINKDKDVVEVIFDKQGCLSLIEYLKEVVNTSDNINHIHLMTKDWGGGGLSNELMNKNNILINHAKLVYLTS